MIEMKQKKYLLGIVIFIVLAAIVIIPNMILSITNEMTQVSAQKLEKNNQTQIETIKANTYVGVDSAPYLEIRQYALVHGSFGIASHPGKVLFCVQHGIEFRGRAGTLTVANVSPYGNIYSPGSWIYQRYKTHGSHGPETYNGQRTYPILWCVNDHFDLAANGQKYMPDAGYILTYPDVTVVTQEKQYALYNTKLNTGPRREPPNKVYYEAVHYQEFHDQTTDNGTKASESDIKAKNETDKNKVTVKVNNKEKNLVLGPFSIDYINGYYEENNITFGGISDMYVVGYNSKGEIVKPKIEVTKYIDPNGVGYEPEYFEPNEQDGSYVDRKKQVYPKGKSAGEEFFQVKIDNPNADVPEGADESEYVSSFKLEIEFKWMTVTSASVCRKEAKVYEVDWKHVSCDKHRHRVGKNSWRTCWNCREYSTVHAIDVQDHIEVLKGERKLFKKILVLDADDKPWPLTMDLGGKVWEDVPDGKESLTDGIHTSNDKVIPNVKVTLYTEDGKIATLLANSEEAGISDKDVMSRVNPTYTDENGDYLFKGIDPLKKYYVQFEYNGQVYLPTDYQKDDSQYNRVDWFWTSKGTEKSNDRDNYDETYAEIGSAPANYQVPNGSMQIAKLTNGYNEAFSQYDLMGFRMTENGDYVQETRLIDSFYEIEGGNIVETQDKTIREGEISKAIKDFIKTKKKSPTEKDMLSIYQKIAGRDQELLRKLQFIEDTKIEAYTKAMEAQKYDLYPIYDEFVINKTIDMKYETAKEARELQYDLTEETLDGVTYKPVYPGQFYINQGLWRRQEVDLALRKDILYAATRINGKTEVYSYNKRDDYTPEQKEELRKLRLEYEQNRNDKEAYQRYLRKKAEFEEANNKGYWQIQLRMRDYNNYYGSNYTKELYSADYNYRSSNTNKASEISKENRADKKDKELQLYVTYKITVRNASQSIVGEITELVDYYDRDYNYRDDLSWVMYKGNSNSNGLDEINFTESDYYDTIDSLELQGNIERYNKGTDSSEQGRYERERSRECRSNMTDEYDDIYIRGLEGKQLASGEEAYVYLTFEVKKPGGRIITDTDNSLKENYVEINGYKTYYANGTSLPNGETKGRNDVAGLIDINSTPGNLCREDLQGNRYEQNFENDTDRAKSIKVVVKEEFIRSINGTVWEDERLHNVTNTNAMIGDGIRQTGKEGEIGVNGVTVDLVERREDGSEYVWQETVSGSGKGRRRNIETGEWEDYEYEFIDNDRGRYEFSRAITGNYFVRFRYGDTVKTVNTDEIANSDGEKGQNKTSYNGQDFKSTVYQKNMTNNVEIKGYTGMTIEGYDGKYNGTDVGYYDIRQTDNGNHFSDAKDIWARRQEVINYSNSKVTNSVAEVLASPYTTGNTKELIEKTQMVATTGLIVLEGEYNRTDTDGYASTSNGSTEYQYGNDYNGKYTLNNVDFGLTERPKAQLELGKKITNVKITLANGNILFDANDKMTDLIWTRGEAYDLNKVGIKDNKYQEFYGLNNHRYTYRTNAGKAEFSVNGLVADKYKNSGNNGLIVATMDEELMQGANITISYLLTVTNVGEADYEGQDFYYKGTGTDKIVTTRADVVADYVANNLNFKTNNNDGTGWKVVDNVITTLGLHSSLATNVAKFNDVISTGNLAKDENGDQGYIAPKGNEKGLKDSKTVGLVLTQLINPENSSDDKTYDNIAEITTISNTVGRRMAYSIQGNQDPTKTPEEVDSIKSERVTILPPFGIGNIVVYIAIAVSILVILVGGIIFIKKKVLNK